MTDTLVELFHNVPEPLAAFLLAMLPVAELRGALPIALEVYDIIWYQAYALTVIGNMIPVFFILWLLPPVSEYLSNKSEFAKKFFDWLFARTRKRFTDKYEKWGKLALVLFVAIPLPVTGAWTGSVAAFLFGIPKKDAIPLITIGVMIAGIIVTILTKGIAFVI